MYANEVFVVLSQNLIDLISAVTARELFQLCETATKWDDYLVLFFKYFILINYCPKRAKFEA